MTGSTMTGSGILKTVLLLIYLVTLISGCSSGRSGSQESSGISTERGSGAIAVRLDWGSAPKTTQKTVTSLPADVATVRITVTGPDITQTILKDFSASAGSGTIDGVPSGTGRALTAQGLDAAGLIVCLGRADNITVQSGQTTDIGTISMIRVDPASFSGNIVLGSPSVSSIKVNVYSPELSGTACIIYGAASGIYSRQTSSVPLIAGSPLEIPLEGLSGDTQYYYRLIVQPSYPAVASSSEEYSFHTARAAGSRFTFTIQGDSHPERERTQFDPELYRRTLLTAAADRPDFHLTLGDDFSVDTLDPLTVNAAKVTGRYSLQRPYLGLIGSSAPVFLVNGNHEQAARYLLDGTPDNVAVWAQNARNSYYSQPAPDTFYSGNSESVPFIGLLRNYFAWRWGDALFVVIDPYWASAACVDNPFYGGTKRSDLWDVTHGDAQYQWLKNTLEQSTAKYKFVFAHHVMGTGRGGVELADKYEWGGSNSNGSWGFSNKRADWSAPIHKLMADNRVTIFFQGHDHIWATQKLDGVIYQTLPEPADPFYALYNDTAFLSGDKFSNTGYARVTVSASGVSVEYVRTFLPSDERNGNINGATAFSYSIP